MAAPVVADPGDHVYCRILTYRGVITAGDPWDVTGGGVAVLDTVTLTGVTTTVANTRVVQAVSRDDDSAAATFGGQTNANLTGITERSDAGTTSGNGGGIGVWDGVMATAAATGNTTASVTTASVNAFLTIALRPAGPPAPTFQAAGAAVSGTGGVTPAWPAHAVNDVALLFCESAGGQAVTLSTPNGFAAVTNSPQFTGAGTAGNATDRVLGARHFDHHGRARRRRSRRPRLLPDPHLPRRHHCRQPVGRHRGGVDLVTVTGVTTTMPNTRVVQIVARDDDSAAAGFSAQTNANLTGITERSDAGTTSGNGGGLGIWDGVMPSAGATGDTTANVTSLVHAFLTIALRRRTPYSASMCRRERLPTT